ncbi:MAG: 16S rRNA (guanine(966)-N(2))-methyltransferase RsmD [Gammaproteobacteria bacterium]|nr:16S rRNA (guanine(966)-N(2))-methyltransferase RsmD [Gammaproteobacteria bacterium]
MRALGQLRIIAGKWRRHKLAFPGQQTLRPTPDRVRETLFNWLRADLADSICLDLFAGSGALGFEAASRGARRVILVEKDREAANLIKQTRARLEADMTEIVNADAIKWLNSNQQVFDIVFLDPPYRAGLLSRCCELLENGQNLAENAKIYIEHALGDDVIDIPQAWQCIRSRSAGQVSYELYSRSL